MFLDAGNIQMIRNLTIFSTSVFVNRCMPRHKLAYVNPIMHYAKRENVVAIGRFRSSANEHFLGLNKWIMVNNVRYREATLV